jgi:aspartyl-tRNA(Asn)/glutamyl-tRNA(Gln) amidotransferase subunit C
MDINKSEVKKILKLAGLSFLEQDLEQHQKDLTNMVALFDQLKNVNTDDIKPLHNVVDDTLRLRQDVVTQENSRDDVLSNAPKSKYGFFVVPKMIE